MTFVALVVVAACGGSSPSAPTSPPGPGVNTQQAGARVAIISIDGLRPDAILQSGAPNILALAARGSYSWEAQTIVPSNTLPAHVSMLSGILPDAHGITWNDYLPSRGRINVATLLSATKAAGRRTAMIVGKDKFNHFRDTGACDVWIYSTRGDSDLASQAAGGAASTADLLFVHLPEVDLTGHSTQWMSPAYLNSVLRADQAVGRIVSALPESVTIILTSDHGGRASGHGSDHQLDTSIPWVIAGPRTHRGRLLSAGIRTVDTAATAAYVMSLTLPGMHGRVVMEALITK